jgi:hypothetical protein
MSFEKTAMGQSKTPVANWKFITGSVSLLFVTISLSGCAQTTVPGPNPSQQPVGGGGEATAGSNSVTGKVSASSLHEEDIKDDGGENES